MKNTVKKHGNADAYRVFLRSLAQKGRFLSGLSLWSTALRWYFLLIKLLDPTINALDGGVDLQLFAGEGGGGDGGGTVVATGTPEEVAENPASYTGLYVKKYLND